MVDKELRGVERLVSVGDTSGADLYRSGVAELRANRRSEARSYFSRSLEVLNGDDTLALKIVTEFPDLSYKRLEWGDFYRRKDGGIVRGRFDVAQKHLKKGWRFPLEREMFSLYIAGIKGERLSDSERLVFQQRNVAGEWLDVVYRRVGSEPQRVEYPKNVVWSREEERYDCSRVVGDVRVYAREGMAQGLGDLQSIALADSQLVTDVFSVPFEELPSELKWGALLMPGRHAPWPVARGGFGYDVVGGCNGCNDGASRAVRARKIGNS